MREAREVDAVLLRLQLLGMLAFLAIVDLQGLVVLRDEAELAGVVEVQRGDIVGALAGGGTEALPQRTGFSRDAWQRRRRRTLVGAKF